ncbi:hypothetical protein PSU4_39040 [Pseudonocardia sulfidoxydans NBRC 16205]|uniref:Uncharacterized protein n=1 Tax=Pseudonocardia sulfidoxydans NBRC 16205 TaxID=1223511 RepID=A0A511DJG1_9PSEU|nr:hypothetical protein PSU4_39040 [Pseudonocardia sulfidoxydans NBRC 16205]
MSPPHRARVAVLRVPPASSTAPTDAATTSPSPTVHAVADGAFSCHTHCDRCSAAERGQLVAASVPLSPRGFRQQRWGYGPGADP